MGGMVKMLVLSSCSTRTLQLLYLIEGQAKSLHIVCIAYVLRCYCYWGWETPILFKHATYQSEQHTRRGVTTINTCEPYAVCVYGFTYLYHQRDCGTR